MNGILSEEASKVQADLDHASKAAAAWQQQSSGAHDTVSAPSAPAACCTSYQTSSPFAMATVWCATAEVVAQIREGISSKPDLRAHPLGLPPIKLPELQSGWLADALHQRLAEAGGSHTFTAAAVCPQHQMLFVVSTFHLSAQCTLFNSLNLLAHCVHVPSSPRSP